MNVCNDVPVHAEMLPAAQVKAATMDGEGSIHIWLVDDNADCRSLMASLLGAEGGFACSRQFSSAETALAALAREPPPDVILLDIRMPGLGGLDAVRPIKSLAGSTRVLMMTTFYDSLARARALRDGASELLLKSYPVTEICRHIRQALERSDRLGEAEEPLDARSPEPVPTHWPDRRAPDMNGQCGNTGTTPPPPEHGRRSATWRCASSRLARVVSYLCALFGLGGSRKQATEA